MKELWRDIKGYEGYYQVSNTGRVRSVTRTLLYNTGKYYMLRGKLLSLPLDSHGYPNLALNRDGISHRVRVHQLVAQAFISGFRPLSIINHIDGNKTNNHLDNLEIVTSKENTAHARRIGLINDYGEKHALSKLTNQEADIIRKRYKDSIITMKELAEEYGVCAQTICNIVHFKAYNNPYESR